MRRSGWTAYGCLAALLVCGCVSGPLLDNPAAFRADPVVTAEQNPVWVPLGPPAYGMVFEKVLDVVSEYFEIAYANRYAGYIETFPRIAPGYDQLWKPGSPDKHERLLATLQTIRHRAFIRISSADDGGFFIDVKVLKELEDLPRPQRSTAGAASFRSDSTVDRQSEVIEPGTLEHCWIPLGRDTALEQAILQKLKQCM